MNKAQAKRIALWTNGTFLLLTDTDGWDHDNYPLSAEDAARVSAATVELGRDMLRRSRIPRDASPDEALAIVRAALTPELENV